jgi:hypothetical protein
LADFGVLVEERLYPLGVVVRLGLPGQISAYALQVELRHATAGQNRHIPEPETHFLIVVTVPPFDVLDRADPLDIDVEADRYVGGVAPVERAAPPTPTRTSWSTKPSSTMGRFSPGRDRRRKCLVHG